MKLKKVSENLKSLANEFGHFALLSGVQKQELDLHHVPTSNAELETIKDENSNKFKSYVESQQEISSDVPNYFDSIK